MMHIVGFNPKSSKRSASQTALEPRVVETSQEEDAHEIAMVTIEVPAQAQLEDLTAPLSSDSSESTPAEAKAVRPTLSSLSSKNNLMALNIINVSVQPETNAPIPEDSTANLIQSINLTTTHHSPTAPTQLTPYTIHNTQSYLQPYELLSAAPAPRIRRPATPKLPWLECGGGLAAFTIISGVIAIDGLKQSPTIPNPTAQETQPTIARLPNNPNGTPQVSVSELLNTGRTLPVPAGAMNFPQQIAMNPNSSAKNPGLNMSNAEMNSIVVPKNIGSVQQIPQPAVTAPRKAIAPPEKLPQPVQQPIQQPIQQPVQQPVQQSTSPAFTPQAVQPTIEQPSQAMPPNPSKNPQSKDAEFLEVPSNPIPPASTSSSVPPLQNDPKVLPTTLNPIRSSTLAAPSPNGLSSVILEANPQSAASATNDTLRLEVSKL